MPELNAEVIKALELVCSMHWSAIEYYSTQSKQWKRWGFRKLGRMFKHEAADERKHLNKVLRRLEYDDVPPELRHNPPETPRHDVVASLNVGLNLERTVGRAENAGCVTARANYDEVSARLFGHIVTSTEDTIELFTAELKVIEQITLANYMQDMR